MPDAHLAAATALTLRAPTGVTVRLTNLGATLMAIETPDRAGRFANILLGYDDPSDYPAAGGPDPDAYLGATCGRFANRIAGAAFVLDGVHYPLSANEAPNHLHGGARNFHHAVWTIVAADDRHVAMTLRSPDGDQGYPGALDAVADFSLADDGELAIVYTATTTRPTHVNLVSHGYFNLSGNPHASILDHRLSIDSARILAIDAANLPTGERRAIAGSPFDFTVARPIGSRIDDDQLRHASGYNHNYLLDIAGVRPVARLDHPASGRTLTVSTDQPGLQLYSGNFLGGRFPPRSGVCLEAQHWPDSPNRPDFPTTRLDPGDTYRSETRLRFGVG
ncbi:aldose epimerase family protein [Sphingomonas sp. PB4P5]|uniref:aldose epimerase family protein n=1 Tax=Parasphingomonas puruogangriensis TaxID=3096155 RepID=UPI002FC92567